MELGDETHIWHADLDASAAVAPRLAGWLAPDEAQRANRFHFARDRLHFTVARGVLRLLLATYLGGRPEELRFEYGPHGKPALAGHAELQFNVSHSNGAALFAFTMRSAIGVDVEFMRPIEHEELAGRFFSARERSALRRVPARHRLDAFYACWTRKEAYIKALGGGLSIPLDSFDVSVAPDHAALLDDRVAPEHPRLWQLRDVEFRPGFRAALAVRNPETRIHVLGSWDGLGFPNRQPRPRHYHRFRQP